MYGACRGQLGAADVHACTLRYMQYMLVLRWTHAGCGAAMGLHGGGCIAADAENCRIGRFLQDNASAESQSEKKRERVRLRLMLGCWHRSRGRLSEQLGVGTGEQRCAMRDMTERRASHQPVAILLSGPFRHLPRAGWRGRPGRLFHHPGVSSAQHHSSSIINNCSVQAQSSMRHQPLIGPAKAAPGRRKRFPPRPFLLPPRTSSSIHRVGAAHPPCAKPSQLLMRASKQGSKQASATVLSRSILAPSVLYGSRRRSRQHARGSTRHFGTECGVWSLAFGVWTLSSLGRWSCSDSLFRCQLSSILVHFAGGAPSSELCLGALPHPWGPASPVGPSAHRPRPVAVQSAARQ